VWHSVRLPKPGYGIWVSVRVVPGCQVLVSAYTLRALEAGLAAGAGGAGLIRTEMMFTRAAEEPPVADQVAAYRELLEPLAGLRAVVRVWDVGGDKSFRFAAPALSQNPALGERGIRYLRRVPGMLDRQLAAIVEATAGAGVSPAVMAPMVSLPDEAEWFVTQARRHGITRAGVMIEVPSAVLLATEILPLADFVSVGTNDLSQYTHAADRTSSGDLAELVDPWQPALLRMLELVMAAAGPAERQVQLCGEAAADPAFAAVAAGLGVESVSVGHSSVAAVRATVETAGLHACRRAYAAAAAKGTRQEAREAALMILAEAVG
jgi:phosphoenolpyruvate-protein phosphotransferase (PTS system enzyme I)